MQNWKRRGHLFKPDGTAPWMRSHAANPFAVQLSGDLYQIYFSSRDEHQRSSIGSVKLDLKKGKSDIAVPCGPHVEPGEIGTFDDSGVSLGCVCDVAGRRRLYYLGWNLGVTVPFINFIGLAEGDSTEDRFTKHGRVPIVDRSPEDPLSLSYPFVLKEESGFRMWYGSTRSWGDGKSTEVMDHVIKTATSPDGITWSRSNNVCIDRASPNELGSSRPTVIRDKNGYRMWYSYRDRGKPYTIGYAESADGVAWTRMDDQFQIEGSPAEWENEMICYPHVFCHEGQLNMVYCGNGYGRTGFGLAVLE